MSLSLAVASAWSTFAQTHTSDSIAGSRVLDGVTVRGNAGASRVSATAPLHLVDAEAMRRFGIADMADALRRLPGVVLRDYGGAGGMKTVSVRGFGARHTGVSYDGVALSDCQTGEIDLSRYTLDNVASVMLAVGDNDDIFIPARLSAHAAVLSVNTVTQPSADRRPHLTVHLKTGSFGYISPFVSYAQSFSDRFLLTASAEYVYAENDYPFTLKNVSLVTRERRTNSMMNSGHGEVGFTWRTGGKSTLNGKLYYYNNDRELPGQVRYYTDISDEALHERNAFAQLQYRTWSRGGLSVKMLAKYNWAASDYTDGLYKDGKNDASYRQREAYASVCLLYSPQGKWAFNYSADYIFNNLSGSRPDDTRPYRHSVLQSLAARYRTGRLTVMARALYSLYFNAAKRGPGARDMRRLSPSVSASYRLLKDEDLYVRLSYKNIFRAPTFNESYFYHYGSTDLLPESTDQINLGLTWNRGDNRATSVRLSVDGYVNRVKDMIVAVPYNMFVWTNINVGKVAGHGVEAEATVRQRLGGRSALTATANYTWQRSENRTNKKSEYYGNQIAYVPEHQASAAIAFESPLINVSAHGHGISHRYTNNNHYNGTRMAGYMEMGMTAWREFVVGSGVIEARVDVKNLLDKQYEIVARYPMPGRSWQLSVKYKF